VKACICSDTHLGLISEGIVRTEDIKRVSFDIINNAIKEQCKIFIHLGDLFHTSKPTPDQIDIAVLMFNTLEYAKIESFWLKGNHDDPNKDSAGHALLPLKDFRYKHNTVVDKIRLITIFDAISFLFIPYISKSFSIKKKQTPQEYIESTSKTFVEQMSKSNRNYVCSHLNIKNAVSGTEQFMIKGEHENFPEFLKKERKIRMIFNGHIHKAQILFEEQNPILIPGSIECINFGERDDQKGYYIVDL
jgi:exonuclease SbcD